MDLYPLNLVLAVTVASAAIFLGALPMRLLRSSVFTRQIFRAVLAWLVIGICSPVKIIHYPVLLAFLFVVAWWKLRHDAGLGGKAWLSIASGLGISLGVVLILAVTPGSYPSGASSVDQALFLASLYLGGAVTGLAYVLHVFTRPAATQAGIPATMVHGYAIWLWRFILLWAAVLVGFFFFQEKSPVRFGESSVAEELILIMGFILLIFLGGAVSRQSRSPRPSTSGAGLIAVCLIGFAVETLSRLLAG